MWVLLIAGIKYAVETALGGVLYIPSFIKIGLCVQNLLRGHTHTHEIHVISRVFFYFF
jgi:hypothetical protein